MLLKNKIYVTVLKIEVQADIKHWIINAVFYD